MGATDWLEESLPDQPNRRVEYTVRFSQTLAEQGAIDAFDISSGGNHTAQHIHVKAAFQAPFAVVVKKAVGDKLQVGNAGMIDSDSPANSLLENEGLDFVLVGRGFQNNPSLVWA
ncbi:hypothetical protein N7495_004169 [Penicillium taxi]|uniref:uncharacterized protein n=1 Tax=Penicillium taxi TaxID=168475 RepID=UPI0025456DE3|nr:uncharacterized protein N7495_004169 [Penicillium taxi]KAJ5899425.1 hypothetical protein N7495_004169 [Penicillium taxi]